MAGNEEHAGELGSEATVHGSMNREHLGVARVLANSSRPRRRPEGRAEAAVTMAGEAEVVGAPENGHTRHHLPKETVGEGEEGTTNLTAGKNEGGEDSGTADHVEGRTANHGNLRRGGFRLPRLERVGNGSGEAAGGAGKGSARFCRGQAQGDAPTTRTWARSGGCGLAVRLARGEREDGESADARALTVSG